MDALLLDFNGVIVDDEPLHFASFRTVLRGEGIPLDQAAYAAHYLGIDDRAAFRKALEGHGPTAHPAEIQRLIDRKAEAYAVLAERDLTVVPGARDFIASAGAVATIAVVSGALRPEIDRGLARAGLAGVVQVVVSAGDVSAPKPDPEGYRQALRRLSLLHGTDAWRAVIIEDSLPGLAAARALAAGCVMLATSHDASAFASADLVWDSFAGHRFDELAPLWRTVAAP